VVAISRSRAAGSPATCGANPSFENATLSRSGHPGE
jgi:hypothetical protein